jgi:hypothetical protein
LGQPRSSSTTNKSQKKPQVVLKSSYSTKASSSKAFDLQSARQSKDYSKQKISSAKSPNSQAKKEKSIGVRDPPTLNQSHASGKANQLSIGVENRDMDINELLRLTEKSGILSTRHRNPDFL